MIDWGHFFDDLEDITDREGDIDLSKTSYAREDQTTMLHINSSSFGNLFSQWINTIVYPVNMSCNNFLSSSLCDSDLFLTFNYTKTLEDIYGVADEKICHIHGVQGKEIIVGHGKDISHEESNDEYESSYDFGMEGIDDIHQSLRKPTNKIIKQTSFFSDLQDCNIENIFSWGFSFSDVDLCYIHEICKNLKTENLVWHLHEYGGWREYINILKNCGFKGTIKSFKA